jgi:DNA-binding YbaB/EbfC family protein
MKARIPQGFGGGGMADMLKQAQKMQEDMQNLQADLETRTYEVSAGGGMVKLVIDGKHQVQSMEISPDIVDPDDVETLADIIIAAVNEGINKVDTTNNEEMAKVSAPLAGMNLPGMF